MELVLNYRRTTFGPLWLSIYMGFLVFSITYVYASLFGQDQAGYSSYVFTGIVAWTWVQSLLTESGNSFIQNSHLIKNTNFEKEIFIWISCIRFLIIFFHNVVWIFFFYLFNIIKFDLYNFLFLIPSLIIIFFISIPFTYIMSILFTKFRDLQKFASSLAFILMLITPIFWKPNQISIDKSIIIDFNPFFWMIELIRTPLLSGVPVFSFYINSLILLLILWLFSFLAFRFFNKKIIFWI